MLFRSSERRSWSNSRKLLSRNKNYECIGGVSVRIYGYKSGGLIIKDQWEGEFVTKDWEVQLVAYCNDKTALVTLEIYVNGKLKSRGEGNSYVAIGAKLK